VEKILRLSILVLIFLAALLSPERVQALNIIFPAGILLLFLAFTVSGYVSKKPAVLSSRTALAVLLLSAAALLPALFSGTSLLNFLNIKIFFLALLLIITGSSFKEPPDRQKAALLIICCALVTALYAFYQRIFGMEDLARYVSLHKEAAKDPRIYAEFMKNIASGRVFSTFVNSNLFAGFLAMALPVTLGLFLLNYKKKLIRAIIGLSFTALLAALLLTRSAGGAVASAAALIVFLFFTVKEKKKLFLLCFALAAASVLAIFLLRPDLLNFAKEDNSISSRLAYFKDALAVFAREPLLGSGSNSYSRAAGGLIKYPHNWYLQVLAENGLLGFGLLMVFLWVIFKEGAAALQKLKGAEKKIFAGFFAGFCGFLFHSLFDVDSNYWQNSLIAFFLAGLAASFYRQDFKKYFLLAAGLALGSAIIFARQEAVSLLLLAVFCSALFLKVVFENKKLVRTPLDLPLALLLILGFASMFFSVNCFATLQSVLLLVFCIMFFYTAVNSLKKAGDTGLVARFLAWLCLILSLAGITGYYYLGGQRSFGLFTNPNLLGGFLAAGLGFLLFYIVKEKGPKKVLFILASAGSVFCLVLTKSRGGLLAAVCSLVLFGLFLQFLARRKAVEQKTKKRALLLLAAGLIIAVTPLDPIVKRALEIGRFDPAAYSRTGIWLSAVKLFRDRPLMGYGLNTFKDIAPKYYFPVGGSIGNFTRVQHQAHNEYLQLLAETGILGGLLAAVLLFLIGRQFYYKLRGTVDKDKLFLLCAVFTALAALLVHALVDFNLHYLPTLLLLVLLLGLLFSGYLAGNNYLEVDKKKRLFFNAALVLAAGIFLALAALNYFSILLAERNGPTPQAVEKDLKLSAALDPFNSGSYEKLGKFYRYFYLVTGEQKYLEQAENNFKQAQKRSPLNAFPHRNLGYLYYKAGLKNEALSEYEAALKLNPYDVFFKYEAAYIYAETGKYGPALGQALEAVRLEPNFAGARLLLAGLYTKLHNPGAAERERKMALEINTRYKELAVIDYEKMLISLGEKR